MWFWRIWRNWWKWHDWHFGTSLQNNGPLLSHQWGNDEVSYQDWLARSLRPDVRSRDGFQKIQHCLNQAKRDGFGWAWVDTCCIDKTSSQELSEAINSMFRWYRDSSLCYAYLQDYEYKDFDATNLGQSEWFFRGWTLQELIAPPKLDFYNKHWQRFGSKSDPDVCAAVSEITKIDVEFLLGSDLESASIAKKISWASKRNTSRPEDIAYCLMGLFDINMPLLYGEGTKAFERFQEEIIKANPEDHSLYAWGIPVDKCSYEMRRDTMIQDDVEAQFVSSEPLCGLLAKSPQDFEHSRNYSPMIGANEFYSYAISRTPASYPEIIGKGIRMELPCDIEPLFDYQLAEPSLSLIKFGLYAILLCKDDTNRDVTLCIPMLHCGSGYYSRTKELYLNRTYRVSQAPDNIINWRCKLMAVPERKPRIRAGEIILRSVATPPVVRSRYVWNELEGVVINGSQIFYCEHDPPARYFCIILGEVGLEHGWCVVLGRVQTENDGSPALQAGIISLCGPQINAFTEQFICEHLFQSPSDKITFDLGNLPEVTIRVNRRSFGNGDEFIDIVDVAISERPDQKNCDTGNDTETTMEIVNTGRLEGRAI